MSLTSFRIFANGWPEENTVSRNVLMRKDDLELFVELFLTSILYASR